MNADKRTVLEDFIKFLDGFDNDDYGKCFFKLMDGQGCQGWISEINEESLVFLDSGPLGSDNPPLAIPFYTIDVATLSYWDCIGHQWRAYRIAD